MWKQRLLRASLRILWTIFRLAALRDGAELQIEECRAALSAGKKLAQTACRGDILGATLHVQSEWAAVGTPTTPLSDALSHPQCKENFS